MSTFTLEIDWDLDGTYTDETSYVRSFRTDRGREHSITELRYSHVLTGRIWITTNNYDGRYNEYNTGSALYGYLLPCRPVRISVDTGTASYYMFTGRISNITPRRTPEGDKYAVIECVDGFDYLRNVKCDYSSLQTDYAVAQAITDLLVAADWDYADTSGWTFPMEFPGVLGSTIIEDNGDEIPYWWSDPSMTVLGAIMELADAFAGDPYITSDGTFGYSARKLGGVSAFTVADSDILKDSVMQKPWVDVRNQARVTFYPYKSSDAGIEIWRLTDVMEIGAGDTKTIYAEFQYDEIEPSPASSVTTPVSTTDYTANAAADGGGADKTAELSITMTTYATHAKLELENTDASTIYVTLLKLRGTLIIAPNSTTATDTDATSKTNYGPRTMTIENRWMQIELDAQDHAGHITAVYPDPRSILWLSFLNNPDKQFGVDLFDFVDCAITEWHIDGKYMITAIKHEIKPGGEERTTMRLEPAISESMGYWTFPAVFETNTYLGW